MPAGKRKDPYQNFRFLVEIDGITQAGFREVTIPDTAQDPIEYREGNEAITVRKLPGLIKYGNVTLKWGITDSLDLYNWRKDVEDGKIKDARKNMAVVVLNDEANSVTRWEFSQAWPTRYDAPDLNATGNEIAIETLEIAHEGMKRTQ
ncbi:MAG: phage tail protein [Deltaproteobacteria bacterium]|nr:phage tail protein [Deltaproteobacteria bacterium]MBW1833278.1 phage tail protein [Deltaproteobacteria bacterium]MBW2164545.1 phage tail protein [Deltaproteobacteria bacterium]